MVDNFRPYFEQMKSDGAKAYLGISTSNPATEVQAIKDVGWNPAFVAFERQAYDPTTVAAAKSVQFPPTYVGVPLLPYELIDQFPVLRQEEQILTAAVKAPKFDFFTTISFSAWLLWAKSASECGSTLTQACVLAKAASFTDWTAGGLIPPVSTIPGKQRRADCIAMMRLTPNGFVYDKAVTKPNNPHERSRVAGRPALRVVSKQRQRRVDAVSSRTRNGRAPGGRHDRATLEAELPRPRRLTDR